MRSTRLVAVALLAALPLAAVAVDAPHENPDNCDNCHIGHNAVGDALMPMGIFNLCDSCHKTSANFGFPWVAGDQAVPGTSGRSHRWDANATNLGASVPSATSSDPLEQAMSGYVDGGLLKCSTCHDPHQADAHATAGRGRQHVSAVAATEAGTGTMVVASVAPAATAKAYLAEIVTAGSGTTARFKLSNDNGKSWFGCEAPATYTYSAFTGANSCQVGADVPLNDGANVTVTFGGDSLLVADRWKFYVSYPFVRVDNSAGQMCLVCHKNRHQSSANVQGTGPIVGTQEAVSLGTTVFHHPVNEVLAGTIVDANGGAQPSDGIASNDLVLGPGSTVTCLSCHRVHNAHSNSLTPDL